MNDHQIFQEQFIKIIESASQVQSSNFGAYNKMNTSSNASYIMNESQNTSLMQRDTAAGATT